MKLKGTTNLVTGAAGFIGSHECRRLLNEGAKIIGADNLLAGRMWRVEELLKNKNFTFHKLDLRDAKNCLTATKDVDYVWHFAANMGGISFITKVGADVMRDNLTMNVNMIEASRKNDVKRMFYSSSACVYPEEKQSNLGVIPLKESDAFPANPDTFYGWEKLVTEKVCESYSKDYGMEFRISRFHNVYGPYGNFDDERAKVIALLCRAAILYPKETITIYGDGKQERSYLFIDDAIEATVRLMLSDFTKPLNIGTDRLISVIDLVNLVIEISGKGIDPVYDATRPQGVRSRNADLTLIKKVLGWEPKVSLEEGIKENYKWMNEFFKAKGVFEKDMTVEEIQSL